MWMRGKINNTTVKPEIHEGQGNVAQHFVKVSTLIKRCLSTARQEMRQGSYVSLIVRHTILLLDLLSVYVHSNTFSSVIWEEL
jgi:hypothetical protein